MTVRRAITESRVTANEVDFTYLECGEGPLALCLHGFPDTAHSFRHLLPALADAGFRAVAPYMRGYAPTAVPADGKYDGVTLGRDANALAEALGGGPDAVLIGHDWGAGAAYAATAMAPERWRRVVTMAVPPIESVMRIFFSYEQVRRSFYMYFFQTPFAEMAVPADDFRFIARLWEDWSPGYDGSEDVAHVRDALRDPANLAAALGYYRAMFAGGEGAPPQGDGVPTLYLHGRDDGCVGVAAADGAETQLPAGSQVRIVDGAGHFLHVEKPAEVNRLVVDWVTTS